MSRLDLRRLDSRVLPAVAHRLRLLLTGAGRGRAALGARTRRVLGAGRRPSGRQDERPTRTGPFEALREVPVLAVLLLMGAVLAVGAVAAVRLDRPEPPPEAPVVAVDGLGSAVRLGVPPGGDVELYLEQIRVVMADVGEQLPDARLLAVVHLEQYLAAAETGPLLAGTDVQRVYLRASGAGPDAEVVVLPVSTGSGTEVLPALCAATSQRKAQDATSFAELAAAGQPQTPEEQAGQAEFAAEAERAAAEAEGFDGACVTVFAALVEAPAATLAALAERPGVRGVEPAPAGVATTDLDVQPLLPEQTGALPSGRER